MRTITVDLLDDNAFNLLKDLELLNVIKVHDAEKDAPVFNDQIKGLKGTMVNKPLKKLMLN